LQISSASARNTLSYGGREMPASHISISRSLPRDRTAQRHTASPTKTISSPVTKNENRVSYSAAEKSKTNQLATDRPSLLNVADDGLCLENVSVVVCSGSVLPSTDRQPSMSDKVDNLTGVCVRQSDENVAETAIICDAVAVPNEYTSLENTVVSSDFCDDDWKNVGHIEVCHEDVSVDDAGEAECVSIDQSELPVSVSDAENILPAVSDTADEVAIQSVSCESEVLTEACSPPVNEHSVIDTTVKLCSVSEEVNRMVGVADESNFCDLMETAVLLHVPEELMVCDAAVAAENKPCLADGEELVISGPTEQLDESSSSYLPSNVTACSDGDSAPMISQSADGYEYVQCISGGSLEAPDSSHSVVDICLPESLSFQNAQSSSVSSTLTETCTTNAQQLPADFQVGQSSAVETDAQDEENSMTNDHRKHVGFTIGESPITDGIFRRCSVDMAGRGIMLSRIVEESAAGLAAVAGDGDQPHPPQDEEQHVTAGE